MKRFHWSLFCIYSSHQLYYHLHGVYLLVKDCLMQMTLPIQHFCVNIVFLLALMQHSGWG